MAAGKSAKTRRMAGGLPTALRNLPKQFLEDLAFYYRSNPSRLNASQRKRWQATAELLTGKEVALPAVMRNELSCHQPLFCAAVACELLGEDQARKLDDYVHRGVESLEERGEVAGLLGHANVMLTREIQLTPWFDREGRLGRAPWFGVDLNAPHVEEVQHEDGSSTFIDKRARYRPPGEQFVELSLVDAATALGLDETSVRRMVARGDLASVRRGYVRLDLSAIRRFDARWNRGVRRGQDDPQPLTAAEIRAKVGARLGTEKSRKKVEGD